MPKPNIKVDLPSAPTETTPPGGSVPEEVKKEAPPIPHNTTEEAKESNLADTPMEGSSSLKDWDYYKEENDTPKNELVMEKPKTPAAEKPEDKSKELQSALAQKEHFRKKYEEAKKASPTGTDPMELVRLTKALGDYSEDEVKFITKNAKDSSVDSLIEATKDEWVQEAIQARREKVRKEQSIPGPSSVASFSPDEKIPDRYSSKVDERDIRKALINRLKKTERKSTGI